MSDDDKDELSGKREELTDVSIHANLLHVLTVRI